MFATMKMGTKILAGFALAVVLLLAVGAFSYAGSKGIEASLDEATNQKVPSLVALTAIGEGQFSLEASVWSLLHRRRCAPMAMPCAPIPKRSTWPYPSAGMGAPPKRPCCSAPPLSAGRLPRC